jgi:Homing endonuclease associated repeat/HNH endonuclease
VAKFDIDFLPEFSQQTLIEELQRLAHELGKDTLSRRDIDQHGRMSSAVVLKRFGSLRQALQAANLRPTRFMKASDQELLDLLEGVWVTTLERFGRRPERADLKLLGSAVSGDTVVRRFGSWRLALVATAERADQESHASDEKLPKPTLPASRSTRAERSTLSVRKRFFVLKRDLYCCRLCKATGVPLEVDHIVPVAQGGTDALDNLQALCVPCNRGKRDSMQ